MLPITPQDSPLKICWPTKARTWTLLNQNQTCCQLHHRSMLLSKTAANLKKNSNHQPIWNFLFRNLNRSSISVIYTQKWVLYFDLKITCRCWYDVGSTLVRCLFPLFCMRKSRIKLVFQKMRISIEEKAAAKHYPHFGTSLDPLWYLFGTTPVLFMWINGFI